MEQTGKNSKLSKKARTALSAQTGSIPYKQPSPKKVYEKPRLREISPEEITPEFQDRFLSIKYLFINDVTAKHRESFIEEAFDGATFYKHRLIFAALPCTFEPCEVIIVGGNDHDRLASFIRVNRPLVHNTPTIAIGSTLGPKTRAELLMLGYDDVVNIKALSPPELRARTWAIHRRRAFTKQQFKQANERQESLKQICNIEKLTKSQVTLLEALFSSRNKLCRYSKLKNLVSTDHNEFSINHLRVLIHGIRPHLESDYSIENERSLGYVLRTSR